MSAVFRTEGPLSEEDAHLYVKRAEDSEVDVCVRRGDYVALIGARKMGKTSLLLRQRRQVLDQGHLAIYVDLSPPRDKDHEQWYGYFRGIVEEQLDHAAPGVSVLPMRDQLGFRAALKRICRDLAPARKIVLLLDEVSAVPPPVADLFFSTIRTIFNEGRGISPEFRRCVFVMAGAFIPDELVTDPHVSPFNVARRVYMTDADPEALGRLVSRLEDAGFHVPDELVGRVYHWTDGHLYFTQRLCSLLARREPCELSTQSVDAAAYAAMSDENIARVYDKLDEDREAGRALQRRVLRRRRPFGEGPLRFNRASPLVARLELLGAVKCDVEGNCVVRNRIYEQALQHYFGGTSRVRKSAGSHRSSSLWDQLGERTIGVLDNIIASAVLAVLAYTVGQAGGFLQNRATRPLFIGMSVALIVALMVGYALWERRRG